MKYKLLAIDMDGTFLNEKHTPTKKNIEAVKKAAEAGLKVVVCSGRTIPMLKPILEYMPEKQPVIAANGSIILDHNNNMIYNKYLSKDTVFNIIDLFRKYYNDVFYQFYYKDIVCFETIDDSMMEFYKIMLNFPREHRMEIRIIPDSKKYIEEHKCGVSKFEIYPQDTKVIESIKQQLLKLDDIEIVGSGMSGLEITKKGINKGMSLEVLANYYGYSLDECIAVGNDENDFEMIKNVGMGVAVSNAKDYVKSVANYITINDNNNDAVAEVIDKFV